MKMNRRSITIFIYAKSHFNAGNSMQISVSNSANKQKRADARAPNECEIVFQQQCLQM